MKYKVIIVGAGPVGLLLANFLGSQHIETLVIEKDIIRKPWSKAIGISPPTLEILRKLDLDKTIIREGIKGRKAVFYGTKLPLGTLKIENLLSRYSFILTLSQAKTEKILEENLKNYSSIALSRGLEVININYVNGLYEIKCYDTQNTQERCYFSEIICACDGENSINKLARII